MIYVIIPIITLFLIFIIALSYYDQVNNIENIKIKIDEATKNISIIQEKEIEILTKISKKFQKEYNKKAMPSLTKIKNKSFNIFELETELSAINKTLKNFTEDNNINSFEGINELNNTLIELKSLKLYYNEYAKKYNELISKFKYIILKIVRKEKKIELFEIHKEIEFEILKSNKKQQ